MRCELKIIIKKKLYYYREVLGGDADAVGERGDMGGVAVELVGEARGELEPGQRAQERGVARS